MTPEARGRASDVFIAGFLLLQIALPLRYYLGGHGSDERFAWRMFSALRLQRCEVGVDEFAEEGGGLRRRAVHLPSELAGVWIAMLERGRPQVVSRVLARRCERPGVQAAFYRRDCTGADGRARAPHEVALECASGELRGPGDGS